MLSRQLSWPHLRSLIYIDDPLKREFCLEMCRSEGWSTRTLHELHLRWLATFPGKPAIGPTWCDKESGQEKRVTRRSV